jgi:tetratricopeptide (TPR) repeat protein
METISRQSYNANIDSLNQCFAKADYKGAIPYLRCLIKENPKDINLLNSLAVSLYNINNIDEAIKIFDYLLTKNPEFNSARVNLSELYIYIGQVQKGKQIINEGGPFYDYYYYTISNFLKFLADLYDGTPICRKSFYELLDGYDNLKDGLSHYDYSKLEEKINNGSLSKKNAELAINIIWLFEGRIDKSKVIVLIGE